MLLYGSNFSMNYISDMWYCWDKCYAIQSEKQNKKGCITCPSISHMEYRKPCGWVHRSVITESWTSAWLCVISVIMDYITWGQHKWTSNWGLWDKQRILCSPEHALQCEMLPRQEYKPGNNLYEELPSFVKEKVSPKSFVYLYFCFVLNVFTLRSSEIRMSLILHQVCRNVSLYQCLSNGCEWVPSEWESDKNITIIHTTPVHQLTSGEDKTSNKSSIKTFITKIP